MVINTCGMLCKYTLGVWWLLHCKMKVLDLEGENFLALLSTQNDLQSGKDENQEMEVDSIEIVMNA